MDTMPETFTEALGLWLGYLVGPAFGIASLLRRARVFHPDGLLFHATAKPTANVRSQFYDLAKDLSGSAIMRFSSSIWKQESFLPDALGCAIRFRVGMPPDLHPEEGPQDLILVTSPSLTRLPLSMLKTRQHDFLANSYHGITPFTVAGQPDCRLRLIPLSGHPLGSNRNERLLDAVIKDNAHFQLEIMQKQGVGVWQPVVEFRLGMPLLLDQDRLCFSPFRAGLGLKPQGWINYARVGPYVFSQFCRGKIAVSRNPATLVPVHPLPPASPLPPDLISAETSERKRT